jgi:hypothetical protein
MGDMISWKKRKKKTKRKLVITKTGFPVGESSGILCLVASRVTAIEVAQVVDRIAFEREAGSLLGRQSGQHLVEYVIILLLC